MIATGSEVELIVDAAEILNQDGHAVRVVSMPCAEVFARQEQNYRDSVIPPSVRKRIAVEAGHGDYWLKYVGLDGDVVSIDRYGLSGPGPEAMAELGMSVDNVVKRARALLA